jgi:hypothetical protein
VVLSRRKALASEGIDLTVLKDLHGKRSVDAALDHAKGLATGSRLSLDMGHPLDTPHNDSLPFPCTNDIMLASRDEVASGRFLLTPSRPVTG